MGNFCKERDGNYKKGQELGIRGGVRRKHE
jgi:hypothetical protein